MHWVSDLLGTREPLFPLPLSPFWTGTIHTRPVLSHHCVLEGHTCFLVSWVPRLERNFAPGGTISIVVNDLDDDIFELMMFRWDFGLWVDAGMTFGGVLGSGEYILYVWQIWILGGQRADYTGLASVPQNSCLSWNFRIWTYLEIRLLHIQLKYKVSSCWSWVGP